MDKEKNVKLFHIGTQKAGSTFLYNLLSSHSEISLSEYTEINFFTNNFKKGEDWYLKTFSGNKKMVDTSPKYFMCGDVAAPRIKKYCDKYNLRPLFLVLLRNPIDYLYSHFQMHITQDFFKKNPEKFPVFDKNISTFVKQNPNYVDRAMYANILKKYWLPYFNIDQFKIISFENFIKNQDKSIDEILSFLEIPAMKLTADKTSRNSMLRFKFLFKLQTFVTKNKRLKNFLKSNSFFNFFYNHLLTARSSNKLEKNDRKILQNILQQDVQNLKELLGKNFKYWKDFS